MAVPTLLFSLQLLVGAVNFESSVKSDGSISRAAHMKRQHHIHRPHVKYHGLPLSWGGSHAAVPSILAEIDDASGDEQERSDDVNKSAPATTTLPPLRQDGKFPVVNEWACALMCAGHAKDGCCSYKDNAQRVGDENDGDNSEEDTGLCEFQAGFANIDVKEGDDWASAECIAGYETGKCAEWRRGRCNGPAKKEAASLGLPIWELVWEDNFDHLTCVPDRTGILRPNPHYWTPEVGYKRGKELSWYQPENAECKDGRLVITAKREQTKPEAKCQLTNYNPSASDPELSDASCNVCGPPQFEYGDPCDLLQNDASGTPVCDCSGSAEYTSASLLTRGKLEISYGMVEMRAKIDTRQGAWSSLWSVGDFDGVAWPKNGQIDLMDAFQGMVKASVMHAGESGLPSEAIQHAAAVMTTPEWEEVYHTFTMEWDKEFVSLSVDRKEIMRLDLAVADPERTTWPNPFTSEDKKFFLILNLAVGGSSGGDPSESDFPVKLEVDYIKYFQKKSRTAATSQWLAVALTTTTETEEGRDLILAGAGQLFSSLAVARPGLVTREEWMHFWLMRESHYALAILQASSVCLKSSNGADGQCPVSRDFPGEDVSVLFEVQPEELLPQQQMLSPEWLRSAPKRPEAATLNYFEFVSELVGRQRHDVQLPAKSVWLYQYSIPAGLAAEVEPAQEPSEGGSAFAGHTSIVVFGREYWYGRQCFESKLQLSHFGEPTKRTYLGAGALYSWAFFVESHTILTCAVVLGLRATGQPVVDYRRVSGFGLQMLAVLQKDNMSFACSTKIFCKPHHAFSNCCRPVAAAKSQLNHHRPPNLDPRSLRKMSAYLHRSDRMRRVVVQILAGLGLITLLLVVPGSALTHYSYREPCSAGDSDSQALFDYMSFYACSELLPSPVKAALLLLWLFLLISLLASTADDYFVPQLEALSHCLGLEEDVAGVTLLALGNGMPDVMTACSSINKANDLPLTMGEFLGAANFIAICVMAWIMLAQSGPTEVDGLPFLRDSIMCMLVTIFMVAVTWDNLITLTESISFFVLYVFYIALVLLPGRLCFRTAHARAMNSEVELVFEPQMGTSWENEEPTSPSQGSFLPLASESENEDPEGFDAKLALPGLVYTRQSTVSLVLCTLELPFTLARSLCIPSATWSRKERLLAAACPACGVLFMFLSYGGWEAFQASGQFPTWALALVAGLLASLAVLCASNPSHAPAWHLILLLWAVAAAVSWFNLLANECVAVLEAFGLNLGISSSVLGITVLAWGNCVGDLVADLSLAKQGRSKMAIAGVYGSPILSDLLGLGVALTSHVSQHGALESQLSKQNRIAAGSLVLGLLLSIAVFTLFRFRCPRGFAWVLLGHYTIFMALSIACELGYVPDIS
ncbi:Slc8b1 [Symbiodinium sp. KB8]|nr:Slc8b1 [Symbiodinium sp. KB8]